jgi:hypothetical protein
VLGHLRALAGQAGAEDPETLAEQIMMLMEGATVMRHVAGRRDAAGTARGCAAVMIDRALGGPGA